MFLGVFVIWRFFVFYRRAPFPGLVSHTCRRRRTRIYPCHQPFSRYILTSTNLLIVFQSSLSIRPRGIVLGLSIDSDQGSFAVNRTIEWELWLLFVSEDSIQRGYINYARVCSTSPVLPTNLYHRNLNTAQQLLSLSHPHHQWTLSLISSTCSQVPLMKRIYPRMKKDLRAAPGLAHRCVSSHEMPHVSLHIWRLLRLF